jgi:hypothetical protein
VSRFRPAVLFGTVSPQDGEFITATVLDFACHNPPGPVLTRTVAAPLFVQSKGAGHKHLEGWCLGDTETLFNAKV